MFRLGSSCSTLMRPSSLHVRWATLGWSKIPGPLNEPMLNYAEGSAERDALRQAIDSTMNQCPQIPCVIAGERIKTGNVSTQKMPTKHAQELCSFHELNEDVAHQAIQASLDAKKEWQEMPFDDRAAIFLKVQSMISFVSENALMARFCPVRQYIVPMV